MNRWTPDKEGRDFDLKPILEPFSAQKKYMTVVSGLGNRAAESPAVHAIHPGTWLTAVQPPRSQTPNSAVSVDQMAARTIGQDTPLPSLGLATEGAGGSSSCDATFGCSYARTISFRTPTTPMPMEADPGKVFERIFGRGKSPEERTEIADDFTSVLDLVTAEVKDLQSVSARTTVRSSTTTSTACARSSGGFSWSRRATCHPSTCRRFRSPYRASTSG
jgi:hypothetical protein